jgi:hypothetical protein
VEQEEPELNVNGVDAGGEVSSIVTGDVRLVLNSTCCGDEMAEANVDFEITVPHPEDGDKHQLEVVEEEATNYDRLEGKGRRAPHYYGADVTLKLKCSCGWEGTVTEKVEEQASAFYDL